MATVTKTLGQYPIGTFLAGTNAKIGNIWIVVADNSCAGMLVWDGKAQRQCDHAEKNDVMSAGMNILPASMVMNTIGHPKQWVTDLRRQHQIVTTAPKINAAAKQISLGGVKVEAPTSPIQPAEGEKCPVSGSEHKMQAYYGFNEFYNFCIHCDYKERMNQ